MSYQRGCKQAKEHMEGCIDINDIESWEYVNEQTVYDISIENNHNYFIDIRKPCLVHNSTKSVTVLQIFIERSICLPNQIRVVIGCDLPHMKLGIINDLQFLVHKYPACQKYLYGMKFETAFNSSGRPTLPDRIQMDAEKRHVRGVEGHPSPISKCRYSGNMR